MNRFVRAVIAACRELQVSMNPTDAQPHGIIVGVERCDFPRRLFDLAKALDEMDRSEAHLVSREPDGAARLNMALDGVLAWMELSGIATDEPRMIAAIAKGRGKFDLASMSPEMRRRLAQALSRAGISTVPPSAAVQNIMPSQRRA